MPAIGLYRRTFAYKSSTAEPFSPITTKKINSESEAKPATTWNAITIAPKKTFSIGAGPEYTSSPKTTSVVATSGEMAKPSCRREA